MGATDKTNNRATYSNYGSKLELTAPGGCNTLDSSCYESGEIYSTLWNAGYGYKSGTSMASSVVAGVAALVWSRNPDLSRDTVRNILDNNVYDLGTAGRDIYYGYGKIDARAAVNTPEIVNYGTDKSLVTAGTSFVVRYFIQNRASVPISVGLGASIRRSGTADPPISDATGDTHDTQIASGINWYERNFYVRPDVTPGTYDITLAIWSGWPGTSSMLDDFGGWKNQVLTISPPPFQFSVTTPSSQSTSQGGSAAFSFTVTTTQGTPQSVTLSLLNQPAGTSLSWNGVSGSTYALTPSTGSGTSVQEISLMPHLIGQSSHQIACLRICRVCPTRPCARPCGH